MKEFNLERALAGDPVVTRSGVKVTGLHYYKNVIEGPTITAVLHGKIHAFKSDGRFYRAGYSGKSEHGSDLMMETFKKTYSANVYKTDRGLNLGGMYEGTMASDLPGATGESFVKTIIFEIEE